MYLKTLGLFHHRNAIVVMATTYYLKFVNQTNNWWHFGVYQKFPKAAGLDSVVWREEGVPTNGVAEINWSEDYGVAITNFDGKNVTAKQNVDAKLGSVYNVVTKDDIIGIEAAPISTNKPCDIIALANNTNPATPVNMGFTVNGSIIAYHSNVGGRQSSNYQVHSKHYVALFRDVKVGDLVTYDVSMVDPVEVDYSHGNTRATVTAYIDAGNLMTNVEYSP